MQARMGILKEMEIQSAGDQSVADRRRLGTEDFNAPSDTPDSDHDDFRGRGNLSVRVDETSDEDESAHDIVSYLNLSDDDDDWDDDDDEDEDDDDEEEDDDFDSDDDEEDVTDR